MMKPPFPIPRPRRNSPRRLRTRQPSHPLSYAALAPPPIRNPWYDPYAPYGSSNAIWRPPVYDLQQTIVKPAEPASQASRPDYEGAEWATGAGGGSSLKPPGTF